MKIPYFAPAIIILLLLVTAWPAGIMALIVYIVILPLLKSNEKQTRQQEIERKKYRELERQREAERREVEMVRKSNEILLHLIQDEHREEDR